MEGCSSSTFESPIGNTMLSVRGTIIDFSYKGRDLLNMIWIKKLIVTGILAMIALRVVAVLFEFEIINFTDGWRKGVSIPATSSAAFRQSNGDSYLNKQKTRLKAAKRSKAPRRLSDNRRLSMMSKHTQRIQHVAEENRLRTTNSETSVADKPLADISSNKKYAIHVLHVVTTSAPSIDPFDRLSSKSENDTRIYLNYASYEKASSTKSTLSDANPVTKHTEYVPGSVEKKRDLHRLEHIRNGAIQSASLNKRTDISIGSHQIPKRKPLSSAMKKSLVQVLRLNHDRSLPKINSSSKYKTSMKTTNITHVFSPETDSGMYLHQSSNVIHSLKFRTHKKSQQIAGVKFSLPTRCYKQVLIWSNDDRDVGEFPCPGLPCGIRQEVGTSFDVMSKSDAVLLMHTTEWNWYEMHHHRPPHQKWIFYSQESPVNTNWRIIPPSEYYRNSYDYIMSYRFREADLYGSYGRYNRSRPTITATDSRNWAAGKTRLAAWLASNCDKTYLHWGRTEFVQALSKLIQVDMYGRCGDPTICPLGQNAEDCRQVLRQHKFYFAFENCACRDYITEKLWNNAYLLDMVPVVFGAPRVDYEAVAPPNSFIHIMDFASIKELANYLLLLDKNDHLYNQYFEWKKHGFVSLTREDWLLQPQQMCQIVKKMLDDERAIADGTFKRRPMPNWQTWWTNSCDYIPYFPIKVIS